MGRPPRKSVSVTVSEEYSTPTAIKFNESVDNTPVLVAKPKRTYNIDPVKRQERKERRMSYINDYHRRSAHLRHLCEDIERSSDVNTFTKALDTLLTDLNKRPGMIHCCWDPDHLLKGRQCPRESSNTQLKLKMKKGAPSLLILLSHMYR
jgi:hypothetical protein